MNLDHLPCYCQSAIMLLCCVFRLFFSTRIYNLLDSPNCKYSKIFLPINHKKADKFKLFSLFSSQFLLSCLLYYCATFLGLFHLCLLAIYQMVSIVSLLRYVYLLIIKNLINLNSLLDYYYLAILLLYNALPGFLHLCLHLIYQTVLIISLLSYFDLKTIKKLMNLDCLPCYCCCAIMLLYIVFLGFLYLYSQTIYQIVIIISFLRYFNLLIRKKRINLDCLACYLSCFCCFAYYIAYYYYLVCCLACNSCQNCYPAYFYCLACYLAYCCYLIYYLACYLDYDYCFDYYLAHFYYLAYCQAYCYSLDCYLAYYKYFID